MIAQKNNTNILILIHSDQGGTYALAKEIAKGIEKHHQVNAVIKKVTDAKSCLPEDLPLAAVDELASYDGIAFGSPVYFGNISTAMSEFLSKTVSLWESHALEGIPATVFMSAGSGAGKELALQSFWNSLAVHGMILIPNGIRGNENIDVHNPQGNTILGITSLNGIKNMARPSESERFLARQQGENFAKIVSALRQVRSERVPFRKEEEEGEKPDIYAVLKQQQIVLPKVPEPEGSYLPFVRSGNLVYINQVALKNGEIVNPGKLGVNINQQQAEDAVRVTILNILSVLHEASGGNLNRIKRCIQLTGIFNTADNYTKHADVMNTASDLIVGIFGEKGKHARATLGASSLPVNSPVEIQAIFEIQP